MTDGPPYHQVAFVVRDLDRAVRHWADDLGIGPWSVWTMEPSALQQMLYRGRPAEFRFRHALAWSGSMQFELVEPLAGPSIFTDQLDTSGEGFHHIGKIVPDHPAAVADLLGRGFTSLQSARGFGASQDGVFAYFAPPEDLGVIVELISPPTTRFRPDYTYPDGGVPA